MKTNHSFFFVFFFLYIFPLWQGGDEESSFSLNRVINNPLSLHFHQSLQILTLKNKKPGFRFLQGFFPLDLYVKSYQSCLDLKSSVVSGKMMIFLLKCFLNVTLCFRKIHEKSVVC